MFIVKNVPPPIVVTCVHLDPIVIPIQCTCCDLNLVHLHMLDIASNNNVKFSAANALE